MLSLQKLVYGAPSSQALGTRSTNGNGSGSLSGAEIAGLVMGVVGVVLTALTVLKGWECWRRNRTNETVMATQNHTSSPAPAITQIFYIYPPTLLSPHPVSPEHEVPLQAIVSLRYAPVSQTQSPMPSPGPLRMQTCRTST
ncbi:hypothetical protein K440DRAFT_642227 [Wilcoxina mikolae CBS 423.85]|nr:hypothetical protein K440DRAFT_642227 [Wilcoxina mikolae CBS 423.85]